MSERRALQSQECAHRPRRSLCSQSPEHQTGEKSSFKTPSYRASIATLAGQREATEGVWQGTCFGGSAAAHPALVTPQVQCCVLEHLAALWALPGAAAASINLSWPGSKQNPAPAPHICADPQQEYLPGDPPPHRLQDRGPWDLTCTQYTWQQPGIRRTPTPSRS